MTGIVNSTGARSGIIGTTVGTPAGGIVLQVKTHLPAFVALGTTSQNWPSTALGFDNPIIASSHVLMFFSATFEDTVAGATNHVNVYFNGGGLDAGTSGRQIMSAEMYQNSGIAAVRTNVSGHTLDTAPPSTTPTYNLWFTMNLSINLNVNLGTFTFMEIAR